MKQKIQLWVYHQQEKKFLLLKVIPERGSHWQPITGGVDARESFLTAAKREFKEETQLNDTEGKWVDLQYSFTYEGRWGMAQEHLFLYVLQTKDLPKPTLDPKEHTQYEWVSTSEVPSRLYFSSQKNIFQLIQDDLP